MTPAKPAGQEWVQPMAENGRDCIHGHLARKCPHCEADRTEHALKAEVERLKEALREAARLIESEYCSHPDPHGEHNPRCYTQFIYAALKESSGK